MQLSPYGFFAHSVLGQVGTDRGSRSERYGIQAVPSNFCSLIQNCVEPVMVPEESSPSEEPLSSHSSDPLPSQSGKGSRHYHMSDSVYVVRHY